MDWLPSDEAPELVTLELAGDEFEFPIGEYRSRYDCLGAELPKDAAAPRHLHPRVCGENDVRCASIAIQGGLPPLVLRARGESIGTLTPAPCISYYRPKFV